MKLHALFFLVVAILCVFLLFVPFTRRFRDASRWLHVAFVAGSLFVITWSVLGLFLLSHQIADHTDLPWPRFWALSHMKSDIGGIGAGILVAVVTSPEFRSRRRRVKSSV